MLLGKPCCLHFSPPPWATTTIPKRHGATSHRFLSRANKTWIDHTSDEFKNLFTQELFFFRPPKPLFSLIGTAERVDVPPSCSAGNFCVDNGSWEPGAAFPTSHPSGKWGFSSRFLTKLQPGVVSAFSLTPHSTPMGRGISCKDEFKILSL